MSTRDVTMDVKGVQLVVSVLLPVNGKPARRWAIRLHGSKQEIDELLADHVLQQIDGRIIGALEHASEGDEIPFDVPTSAGGTP